MESLPIEILDHVFNQFPSRCEICQQKCFRALAWQEFPKCANTCKRWNLWIQKKIKDLDVIKKCYSEFENLISVTLNTHQVEEFGIRIKIYHPYVGPRGAVIESIIENGLVCRDGRIKIGDVILKVNEISFNNSRDTWLQKKMVINVLRDALKLQFVKLVVGQGPSRYITRSSTSGGYHLIEI